jgi:outer membrane receptor for ferrienterochelin and colicin
VQEAEILGLDYELETRVSDQFKLYGNLGWLRGRDLEADSPLPQIAPLNGLGGVRYEDGSGMFAALELPFSARQHLPSTGARATKAWVSLDLRLGFEQSCGQPFQRQKVFAGVLNAFDSAYKEYLTTTRGFDFNEPGRSFVLGYELQF